MSSVTHPPETNEGIVTSWIPLTSAWPSIPECATGGIYSQGGGNGAKAIADDPFYGLSIDSSLTCLPPAATLWWDQTTATPLLTHTSLGPIVCPGGYTTATTSVVDDISTFVGCCPSHYAFEGTKDSGTVGQCNSPLPVGQVLTYVDLNLNPVASTTTTISAAGASVFAVHLNGYIFAPSSTTSSSSSSSTGSSQTTSTAPSQATNTGSTGSQTSSTGGLSTGAKAGLGVGVVLGVLLLIALVVKLFQWRRNKMNAGASDSRNNFDGPSPPSGNGAGGYYANRKPERYEMVPNGMEQHEMEQPTTTRYELPATQR